MVEVFVGSEALSRGALTRHELQRYHTRLFPDVYHPRGQQPSLRDRTLAAWLWSGRRAVIAGAAAAALHGSDWVDREAPIELIWENGRPPAGLIVRNETLHADESTCVAGLPVTTITRTAFDLGRHLRRGQALARLDALARAAGVTARDIHLLAQRHRGARGVRRLRELLALVDGGAASPKETWLRLLFIDAGLPAPRTQIPVYAGGGLVALLDMGWEEFKVSAEYDGDQHRSDRRQYVWDQRRARLVAALGWKEIRVIKEDRPAEVVGRVRDALMSRGWRREIDATQGASRCLSA